MISSRRHNAGLTLIELLVTISVVAILAGLAVSNFRTLINNSIRTATVNNFVGYLQYARGEAIKRNVNIVICKSTDGESCVTSGEWEAGWLVFLDHDDDGVLEDIDADDVLAKGIEILKIQTALDGSISFRSSSNVIAYKRDGTTDGTIDFTFCDSRGASYSKTVNVYMTGRQEVSETLSNGGAPSCPS